MTAEIINLAEYKKKKQRKAAYDLFRQELQKGCTIKLPNYEFDSFQETLEDLKRDIAARSSITPYELFRISSYPKNPTGIIPTSTA